MQDDTQNNIEEQRSSRGNLISIEEIDKLLASFD